MAQFRAAQLSSAFDINRGTDPSDDCSASTGDDCPLNGMPRLHPKRNPN